MLVTWCPRSRRRTLRLRPTLRRLLLLVATEARWLRQWLLLLLLLLLGYEVLLLLDEVLVVGCGVEAGVPLDDPG